MSRQHMSHARLFVWLLLAFAGLAMTSARAQDRCEGTLCDLYYKNAPPPAPAQPGAAPAQQPRYLGDMFGFFKSAPAAPGAAAAPQPQQATRCEGTLCDFYYGGQTEREKAWPNAPPPAAAATAPQPAPVAAAPVSSRYRGPDADAQEEAERNTFVERPQPTVCAGTKADPWKCYR